MNKSDFTTHFKVELTEDGSPSLWLYKGEKIAEMMHQSGGAATETIYIYGDAISRCLRAWDLRANYLSVGLGLGYVELLISLLYQGHLEKLGKIASFEIENELKNQFGLWLSDHPAVYDYDSALRVLQNLNQTHFSKKEITSVFENRLQMFGGLSLENLNSFPAAEKCHVICYDAFSSHTDLELWSEEFLDAFLNKFAADQCIFSTYACTSLLKRVLKSQGFKLIPKAGFDGKREATLAIRD